MPWRETPGASREMPASSPLVARAFRLGGGELSCDVVSGVIRMDHCPSLILNPSLSGVPCRKGRNMGWTKPEQIPSTAAFFSTALVNLGIDSRLLFVHRGKWGVDDSLWYRIHVTKHAQDCGSQQAAIGTEGWVCNILVSAPS